jgi:hypothetical protein
VERGHPSTVAADLRALIERVCRRRRLPSSVASVGACEQRRRISSRW